MYLVYKLEHMNNKMKKYTVNDRYFKELNEDSAYWLGVMYADGNVSENHKGTTGRVILSSTDKEWVENFSKVISYSGPVREEIHKKFKKSIWKVTIDSRALFEDLVKNGCVPKKSLVIKFPSIEKKLERHFIRGYFDGDGSVTVCKNIKSANWKILKTSFCSGSKEFLQELVERLPSKNKSVYSGKRIYEIKLSLNDSLNLYHYMYENSGEKLARKFIKFENYVMSYKPRGGSETTISHP